MLTPSDRRKHYVFGAVLGLLSVVFAISLVQNEPMFVPFSGLLVAAGAWCYGLKGGAGCLTVTLTAAVAYLELSGASGEEGKQGRVVKIDPVSFILSTHLGFLITFAASILLRTTQLRLEETTRVLRGKNAELTAALAQVKELHGLLPICMYCKDIRNEKGYWGKLEDYFRRHANVKFSHGLCPKCFRIHFPEEWATAQQQQRQPNATPCDR